MAVVFFCAIEWVHRLQVARNEGRPPDEVDKSSGPIRP